MVAVVHTAPTGEAPRSRGAWLEQLALAYGPAERDLLRRALDFALAAYGETLTPEGEPWIERAAGTAAILAGLQLDATSLAGALLVGLPACAPEDAALLEETLSAEIAGMVAGVARMGEIRAANLPPANDADRAAQSESLRKMLLSMVEDIRVVLIKLAERLQALRFLMGGDSSLLRENAREVRDLFAPLANRLGVWQIKWELEDLALRALDPGTYKQIARLLDERRLDRQQYITEVIDTLKGELATAGIKGEITGRPKHIYSIYKKIQRKEVLIDEIYDIRAVRILVEDLKDCYTVLGLVHHLWTPITKEFDDYIARPKANDYRSLHTAVIGPESKALEVQIRTFEMHQHSEYGVAAHWRYKEGGRHDPSFDEKIAWLRQVLEWKSEVTNAGEWLQQFKSSLFTDAVYVFTPQGRVIDLPRGATPIDFAYHVHTNLGHRCRGAKVDGHMVPLNYALQSGQRVEVLTVKQGGPSRDWLNPTLGFVNSSRARAKLRQWFKAQQLLETVAQGRSLVEKELQREGLTALKLEDCAQAAGFHKAEEFFAAVARGEVNSRDLHLALRAAAGQDSRAEAPAELAPEAITHESRAGKSGSGILIVGVDKLLTGLARCCKPVPPDPIIGFVTRGKGITIHRKSCSNVARMQTDHPERLITADWGEAREEVFPIDLEVVASDRQSLLRDISEVFSREKINVTAVNTLSKNMQARMFFTVEVRGVEHLKRMLKLVQDVPGVMNVRRR
jgi:GTP pyrophosphokinase